MSFDKSSQIQAQAELNRKKKEKTEKEKKLEKQKILDQEAKKKEARENGDKTKDTLHKLEDLLDNDFADLDSSDAELMKKALEGGDISKDEIEDILNKIDEIESNDKVDKYLPKEFRITSEDYKQSLIDPIVRLQTITKLDTSLTVLADNINPDSSMGMNLFAGYMAILDKNLIQIQENTIDVTDSLKNLEEKKSPSKQEKLSFLQKLLKFLKEAFTS